MKIIVITQLVFTGSQAFQKWPKMFMVHIISIKGAELAMAYFIVKMHFIYKLYIYNFIFKFIIKIRIKIRSMFD